MKSITFRGHNFNFVKDDDFWNGLTRTTDQWEPELFDTIDKYLGEKKNFLDIGAWNGIASLYAAKLGARCYSIEPDQEAYNALCENILWNDAHTVFPSQNAIADYSGYIHLFNHDKFGNSMSSVLRKDGDYVKVPCITIDYFRESFDLIKMDIEGAELSVIPSSMTWFKSQQCPMHLSLHPAYYPNGIEDMKLLSYHMDQAYAITEINDTTWICLPKI